MPMSRVRKPQKKSPGRPPDPERADRKTTESWLGAERRKALKDRAHYETTINRLRGMKHGQRVTVNELICRAVDELLVKYPPRPQDAVTAALEQVQAQA